ncbi:tryptophan--tRNA ligase [Candidatus Berkelbacteria bacterium]|nr:tryptophan--tRNA ligase [Candidatus Berkelbacteria bacterium]
MRVLSGIQPSGILHLGNYLGALQQHIALQDEAEEAMYTIVDLHAITLPQDPEKLRSQTLGVAAMYLALGLDPNRSILFIQSHVSAHTELGWILTTLATMGDLERMTQFKEKGRGRERGGVGVGLFAYPTLMAADILLYRPSHVPVGADQVQHVELARDLAKRFNQRFGETLTVPEPRLKKETARIMALDDPSVKMSKSAASEYNYIALTDDAETIRRKIQKAVTDSGSTVELADEKPALKNLLTIFAGVTDREPTEIAGEFAGKGYADFKAALADAIIAFLGPVQTKYTELMANDAALVELLHAGAERARPIAEDTLVSVKDRVGFVA